MGPSVSLATLRPELASSLEDFDLEADRLGFIGMALAPVIEVPVSSGQYGRIPTEQMLQTQDTLRAPGSVYNRRTGRFEIITFATRENGFEEPVDDREARLFIEYFDGQVLAARRARDVVLRAYEGRIAALGAAVTNVTAATATWDTIATADPVLDFTKASILIFDRTGLRPNVVAFTWKALQHLKNADKFVDRLKFSGFQDPSRRGINLQAIAEAFDVDRVVIAGSKTNSANEAKAAVLSSIWDDTRAYVAHVPVTDDPKEAGWMRTYHWGEDGSEIGALMETYRDEPRRSEIVRARMDTDEKEILPAAVEAITGVL